ncbi:MAG: TasA family protein [Actinomycetota bacterium]|nr:TasA family protein [Actinomycetota bacterium]
MFSHYRHSPTRKRVKPLGKIALAATLCAAGAALAFQGAFAEWTSGATGGPQSISTGTVTIALGATGAKTNRLTVNATNVAPGDTIARSVDLSNVGTLNLASVTLGISAKPSSTLDTDGTNGLQVSISSCSVAWSESGPPYTYTCSGTTSSVLSTSVSALESSAAPLDGLNALTAGGTDHLVVTLTLPTSAPSSMEGLTSTLSYNFTGTQATGQAA